MTTVSHPVSGCLSGFRIGRLACGDEHPDAATSAHLHTCARCSEALATQQADVAAAKLEAIPQRLKLAPKKARAEGLWARGVGMTFMATAACAVWLMIPRPSETAATQLTHIKGSIAMVATIQRDNAIVADEVALEKLQSLQTNDRMRLRVLAAQGASVDVVTSGDGEHWEPVYHGTLGADRWLPVGLRLDMATPTYFKLRVCENPSDDTHCDEQTYKL